MRDCDSLAIANRHRRRCVEGIKHDLPERRDEEVGEHLLDFIDEMVRALRRFDGRPYRRGDRGLQAFTDDTRREQDMALDERLGFLAHELRNAVSSAGREA